MESRIKYACISFLDEKGKFGYVPIEKIKAQRNSKEHLTPSDKTDFDKEKRYFVYWCECNQDVCSKKNKECQYFKAYIVKLGESKEELKNLKQIEHENDKVRASNRLRLPKRQYSPISDSSYDSDSSAETISKAAKKQKLQKVIRENNSKITLSKFHLTKNREPLRDSSSDEGICKKCTMTEQTIKEQEKQIEELKSLNESLQNRLQSLLQKDEADEVYASEIMENDPDVHVQQISKNTNDKEMERRGVDDNGMESADENEIEIKRSGSHEAEKDTSYNSDKDPVYEKIFQYKPRLYKTLKLHEVVEHEPTNSQYERYTTLDNGNKIYLGLDYVIKKNTWEAVKRKKKALFFRELALILWSRKELQNRCLDKNKATK